MAENAANQGVWLDANRYYDAEARFYEAPVSVHESNKRANPGSPVAANQMTDGISHSSLASEIACARQKIQNFLKSGGDVGVERFENSQKQIETILKQLAKLTTDMNDVLSRVSTIEKFMKTLKPQNNEIKASVKNETKTTIQNGSSNAAGDDDDLDLFGSDEEDDAEAAKLKEERLQAYANKKAKKPALVAKSSVVLDVKPWDDETDMKEMEKAVRAVETDGLVWGASKLVPLAYGINKLQIVAIVEDEKVSIDWLQEKISENEDLVQSVDIAAFNKL